MIAAQIDNILCLAFREIIKKRKLDGIVSSYWSRKVVCLGLTQNASIHQLTQQGNSGWQKTSQAFRKNSGSVQAKVNPSWVTRTVPRPDKLTIVFLFTGAKLDSFSRKAERVLSHWGFPQRWSLFGSQHLDLLLCSIRAPAHPQLSLGHDSLLEKPRDSILWVEFQVDPASLEWAVVMQTPLQTGSCTSQE